MRNLSALARSFETEASILSPVFEHEARNEIKTIHQQQQQHDRYAGLTSSQMREIIRQQQM